MWIVFYQKSKTGYKRVSAKEIIELRLDEGHFTSYGINNPVKCNHEIKLAGEKIKSAVR